MSGRLEQVVRPPELPPELTEGRDVVAALSRALKQTAIAAAWEPLRWAASDPAGQKLMLKLLSSGEVAFAHDTLVAQLAELIETRNPQQELSPAALEALVLQHLDGTPLADAGTWVYYPWSKRLVRVLPEFEYRELRTSRNRNKITADEQDVLRRKRIGIVGLSVGQAVALTLAMEEVGGELVLADFDTLSLSNMNRLRTGVHNVGLNKAVLTAREIFEINPYARIELFTEGLTESNIDSFLNGHGRLDLLIDECDDFYMKMRVRQRAKELRIPVLMETSDRGLVDVERFDLEPDRPLMHGLIDGVNLERFKAMSTLEKIPLGLELIGGTHVSARLAASGVEVRQSLKTWPQLASAVTLGGATSTDAGRRLLLGQFNGSGRFYVDLEQLITDGAGVEVKPSTVGKAISFEATAEVVAPHIARLTGATLDDAQVRAMIGYAMMAPSGGNSQPWRFVFERNRLHCLHDEARSKAFLDYRNLASYVSFGAMVENVSLVAMQYGLAAKVDLFPNGGDRTEVCAVRFEPVRGNPVDGELFEQIAKRVTNRKVGHRAELSPADRAALVEAARVHGASVHLVETAAQLKNMADILGTGDRLRFVSRTMHGELVNEIRWNPGEVEATRDGLDVATLELNPIDLAGLRLATSLNAMQLLGRLGGGQALEGPTRRAIAGASAVGLVTLPGGNTPAAMFEGGRALQRVWLTAGLRGYAFQPMTALECLFWRLLDGAEGLSERENETLTRLRAQFLEVIQVPKGHGEVMLFRLARAGTPSAHSLRRHVDEVLTIS